MKPSRVSLIRTGRTNVTELNSPALRQTMNSNNNVRTSRSSGHVYDRNSSVDTDLSSLLYDDRSLLRSSRHSAALQPTPPHSPSAPHKPVAHVIRYSWDRNYSQGLELGRLMMTPTAARQALFPIYWRPGTDTLGITLDVEVTTRQIIVTHSTRRDLRAGSILLRVASQRASEQNFHALLLAAKSAKGVTTCLEFAPSPPPVVVKKANFELTTLGVDKDAAFELVAVDGCCVRYLSLQDINQRIHGNAASTTCEMVFERLAKTLCSDSNHSHQRKTRSVSDDAVINNRSRNGVGAALAAVATIAGAMA